MCHGFVKDRLKLLIDTSEYLFFNILEGLLCCSETVFVLLCFFDPKKNQAKIQISSFLVKMPSVAAV